METEGENCGESAWCKWCQEDLGWLYLLLTDILPVFLPCFAKGAGTFVSGTAEDAKDVLLLPTVLWSFVHSQNSLGSSSLETKILSRVCLILAMYRCSFHVIHGRFLQHCFLFAFLSMVFIVSQKYSFLFSFVIWQNDSWPLSVWVQGQDHNLQFLSSFPGEATDFMHKFRKLLQVIQASLPHLHVSFHFSGDC